MPGDDDTLFGNLPPGYAAMPMSRNIEDVRQSPQDYAWFMQNAYGPTNLYQASPMGGAPGGTQGFTPADMTTQDLAFTDPNDIGAYSPSFKPKFRPSRLAPYQPFDYGPNLPRASYDPAWLPGVAPGSPGWRTPPSPSGPHPHNAQPAGQGVQPPIYQDNGGGPIAAIAPHVASLLRLLGYQ